MLICEQQCKHLRCSLSVCSGSSIWHPLCRQAAKQEEKSKVGGEDGRAPACHVYTCEKVEEIRHLSHKCHMSGHSSGRRPFVLLPMAMRSSSLWGDPEGFPTPDETYIINLPASSGSTPGSIPGEHVWKSSKGRLSVGMLIRCPAHSSSGSNVQFRRDYIFTVHQ